MGEGYSVGSRTLRSLFYYLYLRINKITNFKNPFQINYEFSHHTQIFSGVNQMKWPGLAHFDHITMLQKYDYRKYTSIII